jgi:tRNA nucleotidyltransferase (CCA-adding enzyme)
MMAQGARDRDWRLLCVGGTARDFVRGVEPNDLDIELYGSYTVQELEQWLESYGPVKLTGRQFASYQLGVDGVDVDVTIPRRDNHWGVGHKDLEVTLDPEMSIREAAARRDYTVNSMVYDPIKGTIEDHFGGRGDLAMGMLRATSSHFAEDALRVLRGMPLASICCLQADKYLLDECKRIAHQFRTISPSRIWGEWEKWAKRPGYPVAGLMFLQESGWVHHFPQLSAMTRYKQHPDHHPEGDVWTHAQHTVDAMAKICDRENINGENRVVLMFAALLHDAGKPLVTKLDPEKGITTHGHDVAGVEPARTFLESIECPQRIIFRVLPLVQCHMRHVNYHTGGEPVAKHVRRLSRDLHPATMQEWALVVEADSSGRPPLPGKLADPAARMLEIARELEVADSRPKEILMGRHLIGAGLEPSPDFGVILREAYEAQLEGVFTDLEGAMDWLKVATEGSNDG